MNDLFGIDTIYIPANCTAELQLMDISINELVKTFLKDEFRKILFNGTQMRDC